MKKLFYVLSCLLVLSISPVLAAVEDPAVIVIRVVEKANKLRLAIARGNGQPEFVEFDNGFSDKELSASAMGLQQILAKFYAEGYVLQPAFSGLQYPGLGASAGFGSTLIFVKVPKP